MIRLLLAAKSNVNLTDKRGHTPLYVCVSSLSTGLYKEDLKYQVPCIKVLYRASCDMLNLVDWLKWKGPGIPQELLSEQGDEAFLDWYTMSMRSPHSLCNLCRKVVQQTLFMNHCSQDYLQFVYMLPLPHKLRVYLSRKMFHLPTSWWGRGRMPLDMFGEIFSSDEIIGNLDLWQKKRKVEVGKMKFSSFFFLFVFFSFQVFLLVLFFSFLFLLGNLKKVLNSFFLTKLIDSIIFL